MGKVIQETLSLQEQIEIEKRRCYEEIQENENERRRLIREIIKLTSFEKGKIAKEIYELPMPTAKNFLDNRNLSVQIYGALMLESNWGGKFINEHDRYLYEDKFKEVSKDIIKELAIGESTFRRHINKLKKCDIKAIELNKSTTGELIYKLNYGTVTVSDEGDLKFEKYVTITNIALDILVKAYSEHALRIYLFLLYKCHKKPIRNIKQKEICEAIGLKYTSRSIVTTNVNALVNAGLIKVEVFYNVDVNSEHVIPEYFYSLSDEYIIKRVM